MPEPAAQKTVGMERSDLPGPMRAGSVSGPRAEDHERGGDPAKPVLFRWSDIPWIVQRVVRKLAYALVPIRGWCVLAGLRSRFPAAKAPDRMRRNLEAGLGSSLSSSEIERIARASEEAYRRLFLVRLLPRLPGFGRAARQWTVEGLEHVDAALEDRRGVLLVSAHLGYGRLIVPVLRAQGYDVLKIVPAMENRIEDEDRREAWLARSSRVKRKVFARTEVFIRNARQGDVYAALDMRPVLEALSRNHPVLVMGDGMRAAKFATLELFGRPHPFPTGFMKIAMVSGAPVLPVFAVEDGWSDPIRIEIHPPLAVDPEASVEQNLGLFAEALERQIRRTPDLWFRWRIRDYFQWALEWAEKDPRERYADSFVR